MDKKEEKRDVYAIVNDRIVEQLEQGIVPWKKPWREAGLPMNLISGKKYRGINVMLLGSLGYHQNCFLTFKQVKDLGGSVIKGEKPCPVVFWKIEEKEDEKTKKLVKIPILRYHSVYNIAQCKKLPENKIPVIEISQNDPIQICEEIVANMAQAPEIKIGKSTAYYSPKYDHICIPPMESFESSEKFYGVLFHELVHSTGHESRLNRKELMKMDPFASKSYSIEELTAEMGACYLNSIAGIDNEGMDNNIAYIKTWLERLQNDKKFIFYASSNAQKAVDFILGIKWEPKTGITVEREE